MCDLKISNIDSVFIKVDCDAGYAKELSDFFTFTVPGHKFMPAFRKKMWDGKIKLFNFYKREIYAGLYDYVVQFAKDRSYTVQTPEFQQKNRITSEETEQFISDLSPHAAGKPLTPHIHQIDAVTHAINQDRCLLLSPTASGKSLIIYALCRYYLNKINSKKKILIIVPTISLVSQMYSDFMEYSSKTKWKARDYCYKIHGGQDKDSDKKIIISTWQSIYKLPNKYFEQFEMVIGDECHLFKSKSLASIMTKLKECPYRIGTTGTLDGSFTHKLVIEGLFGRVYKVISTKELMEKKILSSLSIDCISLQHDEISKNITKKMKYAEEIEWLILNENRNKFICKLASSLKGNTLILFQFVEKHGKVLNKILTEMYPDRKIYLIYGATDAEMRETVRKLVEKQDNSIIIASYGTFSTGVSIRRLNNIVFSSPSKSRIRVLQSIGRQLRKSEFKEVAKLYDIADDLKWKSYINHTMRHFNERLKIYESENFDYKIIKIPLEENNG
jgi:superfamily II DNA or RNA helicase